MRFSTPPGPSNRIGTTGALAEVLTVWSQAAAKPSVLLIEEIDAPIGDTLLAVLRQLRSRYDRRPHEYPQIEDVRIQPFAHQFLRRRSGRR